MLAILVLIPTMMIMSRSFLPPAPQNDYIILLVKGITPVRAGAILLGVIGAFMVGTG